MQQPICGKPIDAWVEDAVAPFHHERVTTSPQDDIITLFKAHLTSAAYTVITYADMPLLSTDSINMAVDYCQHKNIQALKLPRGWVFETQVVATTNNFKVDEFMAAEPSDYLVAFNQVQVAKIREIMQARINEEHLKNGVIMLAPEHTYIDSAVKLASGVTLEPNVHLMGATEIEAGTVIKDGSRIDSAKIGKDCQIGPYAHLRPSTTIGNGCRIGNYVEMVRSRIGDGTKVSHMTYIGDGVVGKDCNIGCGVIFCNYNGKTKASCMVGDNAFIGSNCCLVAPVQIGHRAKIGAGSVITKQVPANALAVARAQQNVKENYITE